MLKRWIYPSVITMTLVIYVGCRSERQIPPAKVIQPKKVSPVTAKTPPAVPTKPIKQAPTVPAVKSAPPKTIKPAVPVKPTPKIDDRNVSQVKLPQSGGSRFLAANNFVTRWMVYGPFVFKDSLKKAPTGAIIHRAFVTDEKRVNEISDKGQFLLPDKRCMKQFPGRVNLAKIYPGIEYAAAYAVAYLDSKRAITNLKLYSGSGGYIKIWLNGQLVHTYNRHNRDSRWDQDIINGIRLKKGRNLVVVKIVTIAKPWSFYFRLADHNGLPLTFTPLPKVVNKK